MYEIAAKFMVSTGAIPDLNLLDLLIYLGEKGKKNKEYALIILKESKNYEIAYKVIDHFSTEKDFEFAFNVL